jgi:hypothetical protein
VALDAKEITRIIREELEKLGEIEAISDVISDEPGKHVLGLVTIDGHDVFVTVEPA